MKQTITLAALILLGFSCKKDSDSSTNPNPVSPKSCRVVSSDAGSSDKKNFSFVYDEKGRIASYSDYSGSSSLPNVYTFEYGADNKVKVSQSGSSRSIYAWTNSSGLFTKTEGVYPSEARNLQYYSDGKFKGWEGAVTDTTVSAPKGTLTIFYDGNNLQSMTYIVTNGSIPSFSEQYDFEYSPSDTRIYKTIPFQLFYDFGQLDWILPPINSARIPSKMTVSYKDQDGNPIGTPDVYSYSVDLAGTASDGKFLIKGLAGSVVTSKWTTGTHNFSYENCE